MASYALITNQLKQYNRSSEQRIQFGLFESFFVRFSAKLLRFLLRVAFCNL